MNLKKIASNYFGHLHTINRHRHMVIYHCFRVGIPWRGLMHDLSKYSPTEFLNGVKYYQGNRSPNEAEREDIGYSLAWMHHKGRNRHHFEYWTDYNPISKRREAVKMPVIFVAEMFCDRVAASKIYMGKSYTDSSALNYFMNSKPKRIIHPETSELLESWLVMLSEKGEDVTFHHIKKYVKEHKK